LCLQRISTYTTIAAIKDIVRGSTASILVLLLASAIGGCAVSDTEEPIDQVVIETETETHIVGDAQGIHDEWDDPVDPGEDPCACNAEVDCLNKWVADQFQCGVCLTLLCDGSPSANICAPPCGGLFDGFAGDRYESEVDLDSEYIIIKQANGIEF
jgi:hypothetical protein